MAEKKKIAWITPEYFWESDYPIVEALSDYYDIKWFLLWISTSNREMPQNKNITDVYYINHRYRDIRNLAVYTRIIKRIKSEGVDLVNNGYEGFPYFYPLLFSNFDKRRIIHAGQEIVKTSNWKWYRSAVVNYILNRVGMVHVFSRHTEKYFKEHYPQKESFYAPLLPEGYGKPKGEIYGDPNKKTFLFFGSVRANKRLDLLIDAFKGMDKAHSDKAELLVYGKPGYGDTADHYIQQAKGHDNIHLNFGFVPNDVVADLYTSSQYLILPYADISQSGPHVIAFYYNLPCIASDADGFKERILDKENGYLFPRGNVDALRKTIENCIDQPENEYQRVKKNMALFVEEGYSVKSVRQMYIKAIDSYLETL